MRDENRQAIIDSILKTNWELKITLTFLNGIFGHVMGWNMRLQALDKHCAFDVKAIY